MRHLDTAILGTILYADIFDFPLTVDEIQRYLIHDQPTQRADIQRALAQSPLLRRKLAQSEGYISLCERVEIIERRQRRERWYEALSPLSRRYGRWLACLPFVQMVSVTGSLAMHNPASDNDDLDYMLVTKAGRVWLARGLAVLLVRFVRLFGHELCPNYVLAVDQLLHQEHNLYYAHEIVQMQPLYGDAIYQEMLRCNAWTLAYLPNACPLPTTRSRRNRIKRGLEWLLGGALGDWIEKWEFRRKQAKFAAQIDDETSAAIVSDAQVKGHFDDHGQRVLAAYQARLVEHDLTDSHLIDTTNEKSAVG